MLTADHTEKMGCPEFDAIEEVCAGRNEAAFTVPSPTISWSTTVRSGRSGLENEFTLAAVVQNLRRLALVARPPPAADACLR